MAGRLDATETAPTGNSHWTPWPPSAPTQSSRDTAALPPPDDDAGRQIEDSRRYLAAFDDALQSSDSPEELIHRMTTAYPDLGNPYTLWVAAFDLLGGTAASESATEI